MLFVFVIVFLLLFYLFYLKSYIILANDVELNPGPFNGSNLKFSYCNIRGLKANLNELSIVSKPSDLVLCSEKLV